MSSSPEFQRALEAIKLRAPIEDVVRERVPSLKRKGQRYWACCPFHDESTPSFSVNPQLGIWHCFGACSTGGDQISFLQRLDGLGFMDAVEILAARTGVELPKRGRKRAEGEDEGLAALAVADERFQECLRGREGRAAREYLRERGLSDNTIAAFGLGFAPAGGLLSRGGARGAAAKALVDTGLVRNSDRGDTYDFFRGRLTIPIRDEKGRTVGFGARRLADGEQERGPKYVNTPETPWFHKGRLIYGLDRAMSSIRKDGHAILVEGYTDVMAAHQVGLDKVVAVLGTSTTEDHARLLRRAGARRISLLFDGDEAGRKAAMKALHGLLPLEAEIDVVGLPAGSDPCDLLVREGAAGLASRLEMAADWFAFVTAGFEGLRGAELSRAVDEVLGLLGELPKPVHRESLIEELAAHLGFPARALRDQAASLAGRGGRGVRRANEPGRGAPGFASPGQPVRAHEAAGTGSDGPGSNGTGSDGPGSNGTGEPSTDVPRAPRPPSDPALRRPYADLVGAAMVDPSLLPLARPWAEPCPFDDLAEVLAALLELHEDPRNEIGIGRLLTHLGESPARSIVPPIAEHASRAENPRVLIEGAMQFLEQHRRRTESARIAARMHELGPAIDGGDPAAVEELTELTRRLHALQREAKVAQAEAAERLAAIRAAGASSSSFSEGEGVVAGESSGGNGTNPFSESTNPFTAAPASAAAASSAWDEPAPAMPAASGSAWDDEPSTVRSGADAWDDAWSDSPAPLPGPGESVSFGAIGSADSASEAPLASAPKAAAAAGFADAATVREPTRFAPDPAPTAPVADAQESDWIPSPEGSARSAQAFDDHDDGWEGPSTVDGWTESAADDERSSAEWGGLDAGWDEAGGNFPASAS